MRTQQPEGFRRRKHLQIGDIHFLSETEEQDRTEIGDTEASHTNSFSADRHTDTCVYTYTNVWNPFRSTRSGYEEVFFFFQIHYSRAGYTYGEAMG